jgi:hypothetical protein
LLKYTLDKMYAILILLLIILLYVLFTRSWSTYKPCCAGRGEDICHLTPKSELILATFHEKLDGKQILLNQIEEYRQRIDGTVELIEFEGKSGIGYYVIANDNKVEKNGWPYMFRCYYDYSGITLQVTVLFYGDLATVRKTLADIKNI